MMLTGTASKLHATLFGKIVDMSAEPFGDINHETAFTTFQNPFFT